MDRSLFGERNVNVKFLLNEGNSVTHVPLVVYLLRSPEVRDKYSRTSIIRTPMCHFNVEGVQISEFVRISELSNKYTI